MNKHVLGYIGTAVVAFLIGMWVFKPKSKDAVAKLLNKSVTVTGTSDKGITA